MLMPKFKLILVVAINLIFLPLKPKLMKGTLPPFGIPGYVPCENQLPKISYEGLPSKISLSVDYDYVTLYREICELCVRKNKDKTGASRNFKEFVPTTNKVNVVEIVFNFSKYNITGIHLERFIIENPEFYKYLYNHCWSYDAESDDEDRSVFVFNDYDSDEFNLWIDKIIWTCFYYQVLG